MVHVRSSIDCKTSPFFVLDNRVSAKRTPSERARSGKSERNATNVLGGRSPQTARVSLGLSWFAVKVNCGIN